MSDNDTNLFNEAMASFDLQSVDRQYLVFRGHYIHARDKIKKVLRHSGSPLLKPFSSKLIYEQALNPDFDAFAFKYSGNYFINISDGTHHILHELYNRLLSNPTILPQFGDISKEVTAVNPIKGYFLNALVMVEESERRGGLYWPRDEMRRRYAIFLSNLALDWIFEHELAHITNGHVDYEIANYGVCRIQENGTVGLQSQHLLDRQTMEMDADGAAFGNCCGVLIRASIHPQLKNMSEFSQIVFGDVYRLLGDFYFALLNLFRLFGDGDFRNMIAGTSTHPEAPHRALMLLKTFEPMMEHMNRKYHANLSMDRLLTSCIEALRMGGISYRLITDKDPKEAFIGSHGYDNPIHEALIKNWQDHLFYKLKPFSYKDLYY
ncbi:hypothetical protein KK083_20410 [Fulvivirgaceae bacterium PWU4]|uniref:Uncharacterized protein n=1 Tax=Chryseosolibacter histidini TaxID=2782349 RepID=A0AAP2DQA7_9BACT|nr:hypothetical protein [Chryseosolibacter histidini]MBT1699272.1 hypothetical protein [Chryseosolibacter histidini]